MALKFLNDGFFDGKVGIGTDSPTVKFHVLGQDATFYSGTTTQQMNIGRNAGERIEIFIDDNTNKIRAIQDSEVGVDFSFILDRSIVGTDLDAVHNFEIQKDGAAQVLVDKNGNVGIGTTSPDALLHVRAATDVTGTIEVQGGKAIVTAVGEVNSELNFGSNDGSIIGGVGGSIKSITEFANGAKVGIGFYTAFQGRTPELKEAMRINNVGDVGIGTSTPLTGGSNAKWLTVNGEAASTYSGGILYAINSAAKGFSYFQSDYLIQQSMEGYGQKFMVNNTNTAMTILQGGNVGIGTTNPLAKLDIKETTSDVAGQIIVGGLIDADNVAFGKLNFANTNVANTQTNDILASISGEKPDSSNRGELVFSTSNETAPVERMRIDKDGLVGIGTDDPAAKLHVKDATATAITLLELESTYNSPSGNKSIHWSDETDNVGRISVDYTNPMGKMRFGSIYNSTYQTADVMVLQGNGNVGIGTDSPGAKLDILKNDNTVYNPAADDGQRGVGPTIQLNNNSATTNTFGQIMYDSDTSGQAVARIVFLDAGNASSAMAFVTENGEQKGERMRIAADGNVGIGETDPGEKLDVKGGNIRLVDASAGLIFTSPNGTLWKQTISNTGVPVYTDVSP